MKTSEYGIKLIAQREGEVLHGYLDSKGLLTIGVGHLVKHGEPYKLHEPITKEESRRLLALDLDEAEDAVNSAVKVPLTQNQFDALVSLTVNIGVGGFKRSSVVKALNAKEYDKAAADILLWNKPREIQGRRRTEWSQFLHPYKLSAQPANLDSAIKATPGTSNPVVDPPTPAPTEQTANTIVNTGDTVPPTPAPQQDPVTVKPEKISLTTKLVSLGAVVTGFVTWLKSILGDAYDDVVGAISPKFILYTLISVGLIILGYWLYNKSAQRANDRTIELVKAAADPAKNNVELKG